MLENQADLEDQYKRTLKHVWRLHNLSGLSAAIYTQNTDVETECNGLQTYDRAVMKIDPAVLSAANSGLSNGPPMKIILPNALYARSTWKYTTDTPADDWYKPEFDSLAWKEGTGGFGTLGTPGIYVNTTWETSDIWLRREFSLKPEDLANIILEVFHDEDVEIYLNGVLALKQSGFITDYDDFDISKEAAAALHPGRNSIAVHCHQTTGGQGIDVGILTPQTESAVNSKP